MKRLEPKEELEHLKSIYGSESVPELYSQLRDGFATFWPEYCGIRSRFQGGDGCGALLRFISGRLLANGSFRSAMDYALSR